MSDGAPSAVCSLLGIDDASQLDADVVAALDALLEEIAGDLDAFDGDPLRRARAAALTWYLGLSAIEPDLEERRWLREEVLLDIARSDEEWNATAPDPLPRGFVDRVQVERERRPGQGSQDEAAGRAPVRLASIASGRAG